MKLDIDCVRDILLDLESKNYYFLDTDGSLTHWPVFLEDLHEDLPSYDLPQIYYTLKMLDDGGYIEYSDSWANNVNISCSVVSLTYQGHQFLETVRPANVWAKLKIALKAVGSFSLPLVQDVGADILRKLILGD